MGARNLSNALIALLILALARPTICAQGAGLPPRLQRIQDGAVADERRELFFELYAKASAELRGAAAEALAAQRPAGRRLDGWPTAGELSLAIKVLEGRAFEELQGDPLTTFVASIGLLVVPGWAQVDREQEPQRGAPLTVRVHLLEGADLEGPLELSLFWRAADGSEQRARREPFPAAAFRRGFPVYIRAPRTAGRWQLFPEVRFENETRRGFGIPFEVQDAAPPASERYELLREHGVRSAGGAGCPPQEVDERRGVLLVATGRDETPHAFINGVLGARWRELARKLDLRLEAAPADEAQARISASSLPVFLVARGDAVTDLQLAWFGREIDVAGLVLSTSLAEPGPALPRVPTLIVGRVTYVLDPPVQGSATPFLTELDLPQLVAPWLLEQLGG